MIMDKKYRLFGKISLVDIVIAVILIAAIIIAIKISIPVENLSASAGKQKINFTVELTQQEAGFENNVIVGQKVYDNQKGNFLGEVIDVSAPKYVGLADDGKAGVARQSTVDGLVGVLVTISADATVTADATTVNDIEVAVGKEMFIRTKSFCSKGYCVIIDLTGGGKK